VKAHLEHNGIDRPRRVVLPVDVPPCEPAAADGEPRVVFVGRLGPEKGVEVLLRSARHFHAAVDIVGDGWMRPRLERISTALGLDARIRFHGWRDGALVGHAYAGAHVVVMPSVWPEPFGMVGPEAMAHARPIVASSTGGVSDWLEHGRTGLMVAPGDPDALGRAIATVLRQPADARAMGLAGRELAMSRFSAEMHVDQLLEAYRDAIATWHK
jgi:glycosyltransferase involved in cell wall biosynthesis